MTTQAAEGSGLVTRSLHPAITTDASSFEAAARAAERVSVSLERPGAEFRTKLMAFVLSSIEAQLERLGAAPSGCTPRDSLETILSDQLYRSRLLGAGGIALRFAPLDGIADEAGGLSWEDSHALRRMFALAELEPLQVFLPEPSAQLRVPGAPQRLSDWLPAAGKAGRVASIEYELDATAMAPASDPASLAPPAVQAFLSAAVELPSTAVPSAAAEPPPAEPRAAELSEHERPTLIPSSPTPDSTAAAAPATAAAAPPAPNAEGSAAATEVAATEVIATEVAVPPSEEHQRRCTAWLAQLRSMNGPKQHASIERAFVTAYLPLSHEVASGGATPEMSAAVEAWAEGFAQSYAAAFKTLASHARRPTMVRDIFDLAQRWLNQQRARGCQLLLVEGMRFDLGQRLNEEIERRLTGRAVCREQAVLWAALPSNSGAQRLSDPAVKRPAAGKPQPSSDAPGGIELLRMGSREFFRLERLTDDLAKPGELEARRLQRLAALLADTIVPWLQGLAPDTLVVMFGDHGFHWQAGKRGTSAAQRGGALPEQVLLPASAWLLGSARPKAGVAPGVH
jgi:hypothetical protein